MEGVNKHVVGEGLDIVEQQWLVGQINDFLEATSGEPISIAASETRVQVSLIVITIHHSNNFYYHHDHYFCFVFIIIVIIIIVILNIVTVISLLLSLQ